MIPNGDEASTSHNVFNERLEDAYFDASTSFHDPSNVHTYYQPYPHEKKWTKDHPLHKIIAFLNGILKDEVYLGQPPGFVSKKYPDHMYSLDKALYGLKQAPRAWYDVLSQFLIESDFQKVPTPMVKQAKLKLDLVRKPVDHTDYCSMIRSLMYVTSSRPDIMFATCMCARYQANPNEHHVSAVKRIFHCLKGTINLGLWYSKDSGFDLTAYSDVDHARCQLDRKSTSGSVQFLSDKLVCWSSKKQNYVSISTAESEYVTVYGCCAQVLWMRTQLTDYGFFYDKVPIYCDSKSAIAISCNPVQHTRIKHIDVRIKGLGMRYVELQNKGFNENLLFFEEECPFKFKVKHFVQDLLKIQVAQKKVKISFENADSSSRIELIPSKIKYAIKVVLSFHNEFSVFSSLSRKENDGLLQD
nr:hypothetical protein [Tanacetum cinerariifolium]